MKTFACFFSLIFTSLLWGQFPNPGRESFESFSISPAGLASQWTLMTGSLTNPWLSFNTNQSTTADWTVSGIPSTFGVMSLGSRCASIDSHPLTVGFSEASYLITPYALIPNNAQLQFKLGAKFLGTHTSSIKVKISVTSAPNGGSTTDPSAYTTTLATYDDSILQTMGALNFHDFQVDLSMYAGQSISIAFVREFTQSSPTTTGNGYCLDDVRITTNTCQEPTLMYFSQITGNTMMVNWSEIGNAMQWEIHVAPCGTPPPAASTAGVVTNSQSYVLSGLTPSACYDVYVRSLCPNGGTTAWVGLPSIVTPLTPGTSFCGSLFTDNGGVNGNYANNTDQTYTICPPVGGQLIGISFSQFNTEAGQDILSVFDGSSISSPLIGQFSGNTLPPTIFSTDLSGCLTIRFQSNSMVNSEGFIITLHCVQGASFELVPFIDSNADGIKNPSEINFESGSFTYTRNNGSPLPVIFNYGNFNFYDFNTANTYSFSHQVNPEYASFLSSTTTYMNQTASTPTNTLFFPITITQPFSDVSVTLHPITLPRPGFAYKLMLTLTNHGLNPLSGMLVFTKPSGVVSLSTNSLTSWITSQGFTESFTNLAPNSQMEIEITMVMDVLPNVTLGQIVSSFATLNVNGVDDVLQNNTAEFSTSLVGAYDPNYVVEHHGPEILYSSFGPVDYLEYTLHFQNEGNFYAENVRVVDELSPLLNAQSVQFLQSSHPCQLKRNGSRLEFEFNQIFLQAKSVNEEASKGYVVFKVKPQPGYQVGTQIPNGAAIYFDFNPPIYTNVFQTLFVNALNTNTFSMASLVLYPNPTSDVLYIEVPSGAAIKAKVELFDSLGKVVYQTNMEGAQMALPIQSLAKGVYFIRIQSAAGSLMKKVIKW